MAEQEGWQSEFGLHTHPWDSFDPELYHMEMVWSTSPGTTSSFGCRCCDTVRQFFNQHFMLDDMEDLIGFAIWAVPSNQGSSSFYIDLGLDIPDLNNLPFEAYD